MVPHDPRNSFGDPRNKSRILEVADWGVDRGGDVFELMVSVEFDDPAETFELIHKTGIDQVYRAFVNTESVL